VKRGETDAGFVILDGIFEPSIQTPAVKRGETGITKEIDMFELGLQFRPRCDAG